MIPGEQRYHEMHEEAAAAGHAHDAWSAEDNADMTAQEEGFAPHTEPWYAAFIVSYQFLADTREA